MTETRDFREIVLENAVEDPIFRAELLREALECLNSGETEVGVSLLRDYFAATNVLLAESRSDNDMSVGTVFLYDHINTVVRADEIEWSTIGGVWNKWSKLVCHVSDGAGRSPLVRA